MARKAKKKSTQSRSEPQQPEPMVFEHVPVERPYDRIAKRVLAATDELNEALQEANECAEMRVFIGASKVDGEGARYHPQIYSLTHSTLTYRVEAADGKTRMAWQLVKDPAYRDAAGRGLNAKR